jgi:RimJ/RimL family protein N-acetyltransferase
MRVTFPRLPDHQRGYALVERDDGVVYRLYGGTAGPRLPHDITHLVAERELGIRDGIWGGIAAGVVFKSMRYISGRRPPHAAERSAELRRRYRERGLRAELLAGLVEAVAALDDPSPDGIRRLAAERLSVLPSAEVDPAAVAAAAAALQVEAARWARLRVGEELRYDWPAHAARLVKLEEKGGRPPEVIEHGGITLRRVRPDDQETLYQAVTESAAHLNPWLPWSAGYTREFAAQYLAASDRDWAEGTAYNYAILQGGDLAGLAGLMSRSGPGSLEIGYWVRQGFTRRGLATAATRALTEAAFGLPGIDRVEIVTDERNLASAGVPRKLGFSQAGRRPAEPRAPAGTGVGLVWRLVKGRVT